MQQFQNLTWKSILHLLIKPHHSKTSVFTSRPPPANWRAENEDIWKTSQSGPGTRKLKIGLTNCMINQRSHCTRLRTPTKKAFAKDKGCRQVSDLDYKGWPQAVPTKWPKEFTTPTLWLDWLGFKWWAARNRKRATICQFYNRSYTSFHFETIKTPKPDRSFGGNFLHKHCVWDNLPLLGWDWLPPGIYFYSSCYPPFPVAIAASASTIGE